MFISGVPIFFTEGKKPFPQQIALMQKVIDACEQSENALLESPTGTGKTLALLAGSLSWAKHGIAKDKKPRTFPIKILYASRTHSQLQQVIQELKTLPHELINGLKVTILGSKEKMCINKKASASGNVNEKCCELLSKNGCTAFSGAAAFAATIKNKIVDMEDLLKNGSKSNGCPYYASKINAVDASIIFLPYNYLVGLTSNNAILTNSIVIFDEAHNIDDICRSSSSLDIQLAVLKGIFTGLQSIVNDNGETETSVKILSEFVTSIFDWVSNLQPEQVLSGPDTILDINKSSNILSELMLVETHLITLQNNESANRGSLKHVESILHSFRLMLQNPDSFKSGRGSKFEKGSRVEVFNLWCLDPSVAFQALSKTARCVILTSGTLSPLDSFAHELKTEFRYKLEASHVCDIKRQLLCLGVSSFEKEALNSTFANAQKNSYLMAIGNSILTICKNTPGGVLVFLQSYAFLDRLKECWQVSLLQEMSKRKTLFYEERGGAHLDENIEKYRNECKTKKGACFFAIFRGKLSEGIDFKDEQSRSVVLVGIPYPSLSDIAIKLKKEYQDESKSLLTGTQWYEQQAYRALNQAIGRVIRHKNDYGAIFLLDGRFQKMKTVNNLSKWMRGSVRSEDDLSESSAKISNFFKELE